MCEVGCLVLSSCGGPGPKGLLVGRWKGAGAESKVEFTADGRVTKTPVGVGTVSTGTGSYQWTDDDHVEMELALPSGTTYTEKSKVDVSKGALTLTSAQGKVDKFTRGQ